MSSIPTPIMGIRPTPEDRANVAAVAEALRPTARSPFVSLTDTVRASLRVAALLAQRGELDAALRVYRADLAGH